MAELADALVFRYQWATVQVQVLLSAVLKRLSINLIYGKSFNF